MLRGLAARELVGSLGLEPHPEGGFYRQIYHSSERIAGSALPSRYSGDRCFSTAIYYLLPRGAKSCLHRLKSDEIWHFYLGDPLSLVEISPGGEIRETILGQDLKAGQQSLRAVPAGSWFGARPLGEYALVGATVAPGFEFADFEMGDRNELLKMFSHARDVILELT